MCALSRHLREFLLGPLLLPNGHHGHLCACLRLSVRIPSLSQRNSQPGCLPGSTATEAGKYTGISQINSTTGTILCSKLTTWESLWSLFSVSFPRASESYKDNARLSDINLHTPSPANQFRKQNDLSPWRIFLITITFLYCSMNISNNHMAEITVVVKGKMEEEIKILWDQFHQMLVSHILKCHTKKIWYQ